MINKVTLIGNLGADPEVRTLDSGSKVARLSLATNENYKDRNGEWQSQTEWHNVVCWRVLAERAEQSLKKGMMVYVEGKITYRKWQDNEGKDRYTTDIVALTFRMLERRENTGNNNRMPGASDEPKFIASGGDFNQPSVTTLADDVSKKVDDTAMEDDDLPF